MKKSWIVIGVIVVLVFIIYRLFAGSYNNMVSKEEDVKSQWAQVENSYQRRSDLIPNLVSTVKGYVQQAQDGLSGALSRLLVSVEKYPDLKANQNFLELQSQLEGTENRIAVERGRFNDMVQAYNKYVRSFPNNIFAGMFGFAQKGYFQAVAGAEKAPEVKF